MADRRVQRRLAAILAADVVGYSRMVEMDEAGTVGRLMTLQVDLIQPVIKEEGGRVVKLMGDGLLVEFGSAVDAVRGAIAMQAAINLRNQDISEAESLIFRVGVNVGDVIIDGDDIHGDGVNVAARLEGLCQPGEIFISGTVFDQVEGKLETVFDDLGEHTVKNIVRPIRVYRVRSGDRDGAVPVAPAVPAAPAASSDKASIAVLAFNNMSGDVEQEYFSDGISEDIITDLSKVSGLHVIARNSSFAYKDKTVSVPDVAAELGVRHVLEGSVRKAGNRIRVTAQLIDATTGGHVWAERYDRDLTDIFAVQDELTQQIVTALKVTLTEQEQDQLVHKGTADVEAYNLFLRGRDHVWLLTESGNIAARDLFGHAIEIDPGYAAAHALTAFTHLNDFANGWTEDPDESLKTGLRIAQQAVNIDAAEPMAHFALSSAYKWNRDIDAALAEAQQCLALAPNSAEGHIATAYIEIFAGNAAAAMETLNAYMRLDPHYPDIMLQFLAEAHISLGQYEDAVVVLKQRQERNPDAATVYALLASCYGHLGHVAEGQNALAELFRINPEFSIEHRRRVLPFKNPDDFERRVEGLRKAGLPE